MFAEVGVDLVVLVSVSQSEERQELKGQSFSLLLEKESCADNKR